MRRSPQLLHITRPVERIWRRLTEPPTSVTEPDRRRLSRLLSAALFLISAFMGSALLVMQFVPGAELYSGGSDLLAGGSAIALLMLAYAMNRSGHYTLAAYLAVLAPQAGVYWGTILIWTGRAP